MADIIQLRRDTAANWVTANPVLHDGEIGIETDTRKRKCGNGTTAWNSLPYMYSDDLDQEPTANSHKPVESGGTKAAIDIAAEIGLAALDAIGDADNVPTEESTELVRSGGVWEAIRNNGKGAFDISAYKAVGGVLAKFDDLAQALGTNGANVPAAARKPGMSVCFVLNSDNNYVQYRYMSTSTANADFVNVRNWNLSKRVDSNIFRSNVESSLDIADKRGNVLCRFSNGGFKTEKFDSEQTNAAISDYIKRRDGVPNTEEDITPVFTSGYYKYDGTTSESDVWIKSSIDVSGYRGRTLILLFADRATYTARTFFQLEDNSRIYLDNIGSSAQRLVVPDTASVLYISNRTESDQYGLVGVENPYVKVVVDGVSKFATMFDVESITKKVSNKFLHFSLDDVSACIQDLENNNNYDSIFDNPTLSLLKNWHDSYGIVVSLYLQRNLNNIPSKFINEFIENKDWLKFGWHGTGSAWSSASYNYGKEQWNTFVDGVMASIGDWDVIDRVPRNDYFHNTLEGAKGERDAHMGVLGFLGCDDWAYNAEVREHNYYLSDDQSTYLDTHDRLYDWGNNLVFFKTDFRLEQVTQRWGSIEQCISDYESAARASEAQDLIVFSHENIFANYTSMAQTLFEWAVNKGYRFDYPMNILLR